MCLRAFHMHSIPKIHKGFHSSPINVQAWKISYVQVGHWFSHIGMRKRLQFHTRMLNAFEQPTPDDSTIFIQRLSRRMLISVQTQKLHVVLTAASESWEINVLLQGKPKGFLYSLIKHLDFFFCGWKVGHCSIFAFSHQYRGCLLWNKEMWGLRSCL